MEDLIKKFLYAGVGVVTTTVDKVQKTINEYVEEGKLSENEGKKVVDDLLKDIESKKDQYEDKLRGMVEKAMSKFDFPTVEEVTDLKARIADLEEKLAAKAKRTTTRAKKKPATTTTETK